MKYQRHKKNNFRKLTMIVWPKLMVIVVLVGLISLTNSCTYKFVEPESMGLNPTDTVSFAAQIIPIFNNESNCTSCHKPGATSPDLTAANAYNELTSNNLIDLNDAAKSKIYYYCEPSSTSHSWKKYSDNEAAAVLLWITQGAHNN
ncbi:MAG: hypothetical protein JXR34_09210 [Bacteroidales bacterium]|nr:hypothetical protein [Bacteroidales bacterium]